MKSFEINRAQTGVGIVVPVAPGGAPVVEKARIVPQTEPSVTAPLAQGLTHSAPSVGQVGGAPESSALDVLQSQQAKATPHRRGRTAALRVRDVRTDADAQTRRAFKALVDLAGPLQEALAAHGIKR